VVKIKSVLGGITMVSSNEEGSGGKAGLVSNQIRERVVAAKGEKTKSQE